MNIEQAINYLKSSGMSDEQIIEVADGLTKGAISQLRAEIDQKQYDFMESKDYDEGVRFGLMLAYQIIDKYAESEE